MLYEFIEYEHRLAQKQVLTLQSVEGAVIVCEQGGLWLTEENGGDIVLQPGQSYRLRGGGQLVIEALHTARLQILPAVHQRDRTVVQLAYGMVNDLLHVIRRPLAQVVGHGVHRSQTDGHATPASAGCKCA